MIVAVISGAGIMAVVAVGMTVEVVRVERATRKTQRRPHLRIVR